MNIFKKAYKSISKYVTALFYGMKATEEIVFTPQDIINDGTSIQQQITSNRISQALLRGELTQEVKELRYRTYKVDREAKQYKYIAPTLTIKGDEKLDSKFVTYENEDNFEIVTIQPNKVLTETILDDISTLDTYGKQTQYKINVNRNFVPRYRIEEYCKKLVVRKNNDNYILDFYVSIYPNDKDFKSKGFVREIEKIKNDLIRSDITDIIEVSFVTSHAYRLNDMISLSFKNVKFQKVVEFDGHYILRFDSSLKEMQDGMDEFYCKEMDERYKNKEKKEIVLDMMGGHTYETFRCEECGKEIVYDTNHIDSMDVSSPRDIEEISDEMTNNMEYMDLQISEQTVGKRLCQDCLRKYLEKNNKLT